MKYRLQVEQDPDTERPDLYAVGRIVSFNNRHLSYEHPDNWLAVETECERCNGDGWTEDYSQPENHNSAECEPCEGTGNTVSVHDDVLATLSYYEHGLCKWSVGDSTVPDYGGFDTVSVAGVIVWNGDDTEREWWNSLDTDHQARILDGIAKEYTSWSNGDTYWFALKQLSTVHDCPNCRGHNEPGDLDESCGGYIGVEVLLDEVKELLRYHEINPGDVEVVGNLAYVLDHSDLEVTA